MTQVHYIPIHLHPYFKKRNIKKRNLKNALNYYNQAVSIPIFYNLTKSNQKKVINNIKKILTKRAH